MLEIGFVARCNEASYCNNDYSTWNLVDTKDLRDDEITFGNLENGTKALWNVVVLVCIET
jgi:hypothetical protein